MSYLIVNADDFGLSAGVNAGIAETHRRGIVTSASLMVRPRAAGAAVELSRGLPGFSVGLHFDLGEWGYRNGKWGQVFEGGFFDYAQAGGGGTLCSNGC